MKERKKNDDTGSKKKEGKKMHKQPLKNNKKNENSTVNA